MTLLAAVLGVLALCAAGLVLFTWRTARAVEKALPPQGLFLTIDGARLHYLDEGQGPAIVMIHGLGGQMAHFTYALADRLKDDFRVVLIDRPGSGYSERREGASARLRAQGDVIAKAIAALKLEKPLVVGHSLGGAIALAVALDHPDQVSGLALIAPFTQADRSAAGGLRDAAHRVRSEAQADRLDARHAVFDLLPRSRAPPRCSRRIPCPPIFLRKPADCSACGPAPSRQPRSTWSRPTWICGTW